MYFHCGAMATTTATEPADKTDAFSSAGAPRGTANVGGFGRYGHLGANPWTRRVAAIEAGEPVVVPAWELPGYPTDYGLHLDEWVRVEADGTITQVEPVTATTEQTRISTANR